MAAPADEMEKLHLEENAEQDFWSSDSKHRTKQSSGRTPETPSGNPSPSAEERETALRAELQALRDINKVIEGAVESLERAKDNMGNVSRTVNSASTLLDTWTRILSQTEHNQRLLLNSSWQGATQDLADMENEAILKQEAEKREIERREALARRAAEEERRKAEAAAAASRSIRGTSTRGRTRVVGRNPSISSTAQSGQPGYLRGTIRTTTTRGTTGLRRPSSTTTRGPGVASSRGRLRGT